MKVNKTGSVSLYVVLGLVRATILAVEKAKRITYSESVFVALGILREMRTRRIAICGLPFCNIFFDIINEAIFEKKRNIIERKICVLICPQLLLGKLLSLTRNERGVIKKKLCWSSYIQCP